LVDLGDALLDRSWREAIVDEAGRVRSNESLEFDLTDGRGAAAILRVAETRKLIEHIGSLAT
jgi:hypothetical protein